MPNYDRLVKFVARIVATLLVISAHEFAHAFVAVRCGDNTPKIRGRYTLNPIAHLNIFGLITFIFTGFGWANPVPINPYNFKNLKKGYFFTSIAGVVTNYVFAFFTLPLLYLCFRFLPSETFISILLIEIITTIYALNLCFFVFNLIPIYPLDGFRVLEVLVKTRGKVMNFLYKYGQYVLLGLLALSLIADYIPQLYFLDILGYFMSFSVNIVGRPISLFWNLIFKF